MKGFLEDREEVFYSVLSELKALGVKVPKIKKFKASITKQERPVTNGASGKIFGVYLNDQEKVSINDHLLPKFIVASTSYLKKFCHKEIGLFRKAGSIPRQKNLRAKLEKGESIENSEPNDVAALLKQWLRELPEPLIPGYLHDLFLKCQCLEEEETKVAAILLCCYLLPLDHLYTLKHLLHFLLEIACNSDKNKMGVHNLALIMAPNIFVIKSDSIDKTSHTLIQQHTSILELLIVHAHKVGESPPSSSNHMADSFGADLDVSIEMLDCSPSRSKKKRTSDLFSGIRKLVSQSSTPPGSTKRFLEDPRCSKSVSRSASKRKADPEVVMSPAKKSKNGSCVFSVDNLITTPNSKRAQNVFGILKEKSGSKHVRRQSFGLLKRKKEKRMKSSVSSEQEQPKVSDSASSPLRGHISVSLQDCFHPKVEAKNMSSPLFSASDIDRILSKASIVKKSVSDGQLTHNKEVSNLPAFASQGCLSSIDNKSPYNLRSGSSQRPLKRKSDDLNPDFTALKEDKENVSLNFSPISAEKVMKLSCPSESQTTKELAVSPKKIHDVTDIHDVFEVKNNLPSIKVSAPSSPSFSRSSKKRISSRKKRNVKLSIDTVAETTACASPKDKNLVNKSQIAADDKNPAVECVKNDKVNRKYSISRQNAFIIKPQQGKRIVSQVKSAPDSLVNGSNASVQNDDQKEILDSGKRSTPCTPDNRTLRRNVRNGSIIRGRPNTVRAGLPSSTSRRLVCDPSSVKAKASHASTSVLNDDSFINGIRSVQSNLDLSITVQVQNMVLSTPPDTLSKSDGKSEGDSVSKVPKEVKDTDSKENGIVSKHPEEVKDCLVALKRKSKAKLSSHSDSKMQRLRRKSSNIARNHSFPNRPRRTKSRSRLRALQSSSSPRKCKLSSNEQNKENIYSSMPTIKLTKSQNPNPPIQQPLAPEKVDEENIVGMTGPSQDGRGDKNSPVENLVKVTFNGDKDSPAVDSVKVEAADASERNSESNDLLTPLCPAEPEESWVCGRTFLDAEEPFQDEAFTKRDSIAMIVKNNPGHVLAKVSMFDCNRSRGSVNHTPISASYSTPNEMLRGAQQNSIQKRLSQRRNASSLKANKSTGPRTNDSAQRHRYRLSNLPPPPKFVIPDSNPPSPIVSFPLKELTNISNGDDASLSLSPLRVLSPPLKNVPSPLSARKSLSSQNLIPATSSFSGHTPYKVPKVVRSESSPTLVRTPDRQPLKLPLRNSCKSPAVVKTRGKEKSNTSHSPAMKTRSSLSLEKLRSDQMVDEWQYEV